MKKVLTTTVLLAMASLAMASSEDDVTSLSYISYLERYATIRSANAEEALEAVVNMPLVAGDRIDTAREARMEIVLADSNTLWLDEYTTISLDTVAFSRDSEAERTVLYLVEGSVMLEVSEFELATQPLRVDSRGATAYLDEAGLYRLQALPSGALRVEVVSGLAEAATSAGGVLIKPQSSAEIGGGEVQRSEAAVTLDDDFATWVEIRRQTVAVESGKHVDLRYSRQAAQLDNYGTWVYVDSINSWAWQPSVGGSWQPYRAGRWYWTPAGWSWLSYEPWGWLPYHYGSWHHSVGFGWVWSWGGHWGPAWVSWVRWPGYIGWCPYGYYNNWYWGHYPHHPSQPIHRPPHPAPYQPNRRDVQPPRTSGGRLAVPAPQEGPQSNQAVAINGRVQLAEIDRRGWTVVPESDFASPSLSRVSVSGERAIPTGQETGVVMSGALATRSPAVANPAAEIDRVFSGVAERNSADVTPLLARDSTMSPEMARSIAKPTSLSSLSRAPTQNPIDAQSNTLSSRGSGWSSRSSSMPSLSTGSTSPLSSSGTSRIAQPNRYRPQVFGGSGGGSSAGSATEPGGGQRPLVSPRTSPGRASPARPLTVPSTGSSPSTRSPGSASTTAPTVRLPTAGSSTDSRSPSSGLRAPGVTRRPSSSPSVRSRPRSAPSASSRPRSAPSASSRSRSGSSMSSRSRSQSSVGRSRPSAPSTRSSAGARSSRSSKSGGSSGSMRKR
jgi:hypothetical protein